MTENEEVALGGEDASVPGSLPGDEPSGLTGAGPEQSGESGAAAVLQGLVSMLGEVLGGLDRRMANLEEALAGQRGQQEAASPLTPEADGEELASLVAEVGAVGERLERLEMALTAVAEGDEDEDEDDGMAATVVAALERLAGDVERMETAAAVTEPEQPTPVLAGLERLSERLERLEEVVAAVDGRHREDGDPGSVGAALEGLTEELRRLESSSPPAGALDAALHRLDALSGAVDTIGYGLAALADVVTSSGRAEGLEDVKEVLGALVDDVAELRGSGSGVPAGDLHDVVGRLEQQVHTIAGQPGPGPALAMVAAGLSERFEERTEALTELLRANADYEGRLWERLEEMLDGGSFDELAVGEALEHLIDNQEALTDSLQRVLESEVSHAAELGAFHRALASLSSSVEEVEVGVHDVRGQLADLAGAFQDLRAALENQGQPGITSFGRRAGRAGRRLASDLGLRGREDSPLPPGHREADRAE